MTPLSVDEVTRLLRARWGVSYDLKIVIRGNSIYLQIMWGYLEQNSFRLTEKEYLENIGYVVEIINRLGKSLLVRRWLLDCQSKPRLGKALSLPLGGNYSLKEFVL